ncbi:MAG: hypothetical protein NW226_05880 [Microscillaceae bacterium]|nr:hypothetical protein [Microscillaceae bacterium]
MINFSVICLSSKTYAQIQPNLEWDKTIGGLQADFLSDIVPTPDQGFLAGGYSNSSTGGDKSENVRGVDDYWVIKTDASGNIIWNKTYGGNRYDRLSKIIPAHDGGYLLFGSSNSDISGEKTEPNRGNFDYDYWLVKIDENGNKLWDKTYGGDRRDIAKTILATSDGGYLLGGVSYSGISSEKTESNRGGQDYWVLKINAQGFISWDKTFGGTLSDELSSMIIGPDGAYYLGGSSFSNTSFDKTQNLIGQVWRQDFWLVKINQSGTKIWDKSYGSAGYESLSAMLVSSEGSILLAGSSYTYGAGNRTTPTRGGYDYWVVNINKDGNILWDKAFGTIFFDFCTSLSLTPDGKYVIGGQTQGGISGDKTEINQGKNDFWIVKFDKNGSKIWDKSIGGNQDDELCDMAIASDRGLVLGGYSSSDQSGDKSEDKLGGSYYDNFDFWITKLEADDDPVFLLINTQTEEVIAEITEGLVLDLSVFNLTEFGIVMSIFPNGTKSVNLKLNGPIIHQKAESAQPFSLFGDQGAQDITGKTPVLGNYSFSADLYPESGLQGEIAMTRTRNFSFIQSTPFVFKLVNPDTDKALKNILAGENTVDIYQSKLNNFNIWVSGTPQGTKSVEMIMTGTTTFSKTENTAPYALFGDDGKGDFFGKIADRQKFFFTVRAYSGINRTGALLATETFSIDFIDTRPLEFTLVDSERDLIAFTIQDGQEIDLQKLGLSKLGFLARGFVDGTESIKFELSGAGKVTKIESNPPYSFYGDLNGGLDILGEILEPGNYTLKAWVYDKNGATGNLLGSFQVSFVIKQSAPYPTKVVLLNTDTDKQIMPIVEGTPLVINLNNTPLNGFSFSITDYPPDTKSVKFELSGPSSVNRTESVAPYSLFGDGSGGTDFFGRVPILGNYSLKISTFNQSGAGGIKLTENTYQFSFVQQAGRTSQLSVLNPLEGTGDKINIHLKQNTLKLVQYSLYYENQTTSGQIEILSDVDQIQIPISKLQIPKGKVYYIRIRTENEEKTIRLIK